MNDATDGAVGRNSSDDDDAGLPQQQQRGLYLLYWHSSSIYPHPTQNSLGLAWSIVRSRESCQGSARRKEQTSTNTMRLYRVALLDVSL